MAKAADGGAAKGSQKQQLKKPKRTAEDKAALKRHYRGPGNTSKGVSKPGLKRTIKRSEKKIRDAEKAAAASEVLLPTQEGFLEAEGMERTGRFSQHAIAAAVDVQSQRKAYNVTLEKLGPYRITYTPDGKKLLLAGRKGHVAIANWSNGFNILEEMQLRETVRDVCFLRDHTMFAAAQHKNLYIYDNKGTELHCLRNQRPQVNRLAFLRYHWLLVTVGPSGHLRYLDVSTGDNVADMATRLGDCDCMRANPFNAVMHLGHRNGTVSLWTPNVSEPVAKMLCHKGPVSSLAIDLSGRYMATAGRDGTLKLWDVRTFKPLHSYATPRPISSVDISERGLLAVAHGPTVQIFKDGLAARQSHPYVTHRLPSCDIDSLRFAPYEDVLGVGHSKGFCSMLVPGAGEPNFDSFERNPFETKAQRREGQVHSLLEKLPPDTIVLDPTKINSVDRNQKERQKEMAAAAAARIAELSAVKRHKNKTRGRSKASRRQAKKEGNIVDEQRLKRRQQIEDERKKRQGNTAVPEEAPQWSALDRFGQRT